MSFASIRAIAMRCRGSLRFRSCPRVGEDGQSIWLDGSPNPIRDATAAESAAAHSKGDGDASRSYSGAAARILAIVWVNHHHLLLYASARPSPARVSFSRSGGTMVIPYLQTERIRMHLSVA